MKINIHIYIDSAFSRTYSFPRNNSGTTIGNTDSGDTDTMWNPSNDLVVNGRLPRVSQPLSFIVLDGFSIHIYECIHAYIKHTKVSLHTYIGIMITFMYIYMYEHSYSLDE